ncbi:polysaccharide export protein [Pseudoalteromonas xiamenensis]|uniref:polysaccharide export protein n=1 Tax=Pseudoalteromonas xiamenensis TaxID=882626 RepID=UPI0027E52C23|nr:polysaccharide export protein [Pseudoalteromonas xiamenensis]WMN61189.1 polysaccharide export protein [Pseudoalteromonas xiamenensis]
MVLRCKSLIATFITLTVSGCNIIPGSHFEGIESSTDAEQYQHELDKVNIQLIDSALIASERTKEPGKKNASVSKTLDVSTYEYRLGVGDVLTIGVWDHPELTIPAAVQRTAEFDGFRVQADGTISYAYAPNIKAEGKTVNEVRAELVKRLSRVIENPQVDVKVVGFKSQRTYVTGEVEKPGVFPITEVPTTLIDAINQAGGLTEKADWTSVTFSRGEKTEVISLNDFYERGDVSKNRLLQHGDIVHIARNDQQNVFVLGDVKKSGTVTINRYGLSLAQALSESGGLNENTANASGVFVLRKRDFEKEGVMADVYQLDAKSITALVLADKFKLQPSDIVYVTSAPVARWNRVISLLLPSVTAVERVDNLGN